MSLYLLKIPRNAGSFVNNNIVPSLISNDISHFVSTRSGINVDEIKKSQYVSGYFGLTPLDFMNNPKVFGLIRNPVDRFLSYFNSVNKFLNTPESIIYEELEKWIYEDIKFHSNMQSKFITGYSNVYKYDKINGEKELIKSMWCLENFSLNEETIKANTDLFNLYTIDNIDCFVKNFNEEVNLQFNIAGIKRIYKTNEIKNHIMLSKAQIQKIKEINYADMFLYEYLNKKIDRSI